jgi:hypothetical protein
MKRTSVCEQVLPSKNPRLDEENTKKLPMELKLQIIEYLGSDMYASVTGDHIRADTLMLQERNYKKYFESRPFDYCLEKDNKLAQCIKSCTGAQLLRLPMLAECQFRTYFKSQPRDYVITEDSLLATFFKDINITRLPYLVYGQFVEYKKSLSDNYDATSDRLLLTFLGTTAEKVSQCLEHLIDFDRNIRRIRAMNLTGGKLFYLHTLNALALYEYLRTQNITVPECFQPLYLRKTLSACTTLLEHQSLEIQCVCDTCGEQSISAATGIPIMNYGTWEDLRVIVFCSKCASCLLRIPM